MSWPKGLKGMLGKHHTPEARLKMRASHMGIFAGEKSPSFGTHPSPETREKLRISHMGKKNALGAKHTPEVIAEKRRRQLGRKYSPAVRERVSASKMREKNPAWKGGRTALAARIRASLRNIAWRMAVYERDNFTCVIYGRRGGCLEADHYPNMFSAILDEFQIKSMDEAMNCRALWDIGNGRTLCRDCHDETKTRGIKCA